MLLHRLPSTKSMAFFVGVAMVGLWPVHAHAQPGIADPVQSQANYTYGAGFVDLHIAVRDALGNAVPNAGLQVTVVHAVNSAGLSTIGFVFGLGGGTFTASIIPGVGPATDRFTVTVNQSGTPVVLQNVPDLCLGDIAGGVSLDCNGNGVPDECEIVMGFDPDLNGNLVPDSCESLVRGDCNRNNQLDVGDVVHLLSYLFGAGGAPVDCEKACDGNDDGMLDVADVSRIVLAAFALGPVIAPPFPACGLDPTPDALSCQFPPACP